jgi:hypothetical protein
MDRSEPENLDSADVVRQQMQAVRGQIQTHADGLVDESRKLVDWKHHVRSHPWIGLLSAAAIGYFVVPRGAKSKAASSPESAGCPANGESDSSGPNGTSESTSPGTARAVAGMAGTMLMRAGLAYLGTRAGEFLGSRAEATSAEEVTPT